MSDENEVLAEGVVGSSAARVVAGPLSERDADIFKEFGYTIFAVADLTVELF
jgi:hypothetical protein